MPQVSKCESLVVYVLFPFGGIFLALFQCIFKPFELLFNLISNKLVTGWSNPTLHAKKVKRVQEQIRTWIQNGRKTKLCTGRRPWHSMSWTTPLYKSTMTQIDLNDMDGIIEVDKENMTIQVESGMTMGKLSSILVPMGLTIPVVPEMKSLTVGGLINGAGVQSSSHKYGEFQHTCISLEIVLADGEIVHCSKEVKADLFYAIPMSYGTLGFITAATLQLIPAKKFIKLEYFPAHSLDNLVSILEAKVKNPRENEYVDGIMYGPNKGVVMVGNMESNTPSEKINSIGRWYKPWFYKHVESFLSNPAQSSYVEYVPTRDYFHRYDKTYFWMLNIICPFGNNVVFRILFGWIFPLKMLYLKHLAPQCLKHQLDSRLVLQDYAVKLDRLKESLILTDREAQVYPTWLCAVKIPKCPGVHDLPTRGDIYVGIGLYGLAASKVFNKDKSIRKFEEHSLKTDGYIATYADMLLTEDQFKAMFNFNLYYKMREQFDCTDAFPEAYNKLNRAVRR